MRNIFVNRYNIFVNLLFALILGIFATSCVQKIDIDDPAGRVYSVSPSQDGNMNLTLACNSDIKQFLAVKFSLINHLGIAAQGNFFSQDTVSFSWTPGQGQVRIAFYATKTQSTVTPNIFSREEGVTFDVSACLQTPTDGVKVNWGGLHGVAISNASEFWQKTLTALHKGLPGQTPGTGETRYLNLMVAPDSYGDWSISVDWKIGNLFE